MKNNQDQFEELRVINFKSFNDINPIPQINIDFSNIWVAILKQGGVLIYESLVKTFNREDKFLISIENGYMVGEMPDKCVGEDPDGFLEEYGGRKVHLVYLDGLADYLTFYLVELLSSGKVKPKDIEIFDQKFQYYLTVQVMLECPQGFMKNPLSEGCPF
jgi:hypothetical protein|nr:MAG TPA: hypothetical protein [Herelleviridae sp.]